MEGSYCKMAIINKLDMFAVTNLLQKSSSSFRIGYLDKTGIL